MLQKTQCKITIQTCICNKLSMMTVYTRVIRVFKKNVTQSSHENLTSVNNIIYPEGVIFSFENPQRNYTTSISINETCIFLKLNYIKFDRTFEININNYNLIFKSYENTLHDISKDIDFVLHKDKTSYILERREYMCFTKLKYFIFWNGGSTC